MASAKNIYDAVIIGGGPAGLTAALYLGRARYRTLVVEKDALGGQIASTEEVLNYPGVLAVSGEALAETMRQQAQNFGAEFLFAEVTEVAMEGDIKTVYTSAGKIECLSVLLATGATPRHIGFGGEEDYIGRGVSYCATCDGALFTDKEVLVVGGGYQAAEESVFLAKYAKKVTVLIRKGDFSCAASLAKAAWDHPKIEVFPNTRITRVTGDTALRGAVIEDTVTKGRETWRPENEDEPFGVFVFAGRVPATGIIKKIAQLDEAGYVVTNEHGETSCAGLFAAGDVCQKPLRQVATAVGQAAQVATAMESYIEGARKKAGIVPQANPIVAPTSSEAACNSAAGKSAAGANGNATATGSPTTDAAAAQTGAHGQGKTGKEKPLITPAMAQQAQEALAAMQQPLLLRVTLNDLPVSHNVRRFMEEFAQLEGSEGKITVEFADAAAETSTDGAAPTGGAGATPANSRSVPTASEPAPDLPEIKICLANGEWSRISFHEVPLAHEFTPFLSALTNVAGPQDTVNDEARTALARIGAPLDIKIAAGLDCPRCYKTIIPAIQATCLNSKLTLHVYDIAHFPALQRAHNILSAPFTIVNDGEIRKPGGNISSMNDLLEVLQPYMQ